jgi:uncharacterized protein (TIGR02453 family)
MTNPPFRGFPVDLFDFLHALSRNNSREWFADNKNRYRSSVVEPMCEFIAAVAPRLRGVSEHFIADPRPNGGSMFRIHRDVRFSSDKRPYKEHAACQFRHEAASDVHAPGFYVHLAPEGVLYGGGIWKPPTAALGKVRDRIVQAPAIWQGIRDAPGLLAQFESIDGEQLKRLPRGYPETSPHPDDLRRKTYFLMRRDSAGSALRPEFLDDVASAFAAAAPMMKFISEALDIPF